MALVDILKYFKLKLKWNSIYEKLTMALIISTYLLLSINFSPCFKNDYSVLWCHFKKLFRALMFSMSWLDCHISQWIWHFSLAIRKNIYIYDKYYHKFMALSLHHYSMILIGYAQDITNTAAYLTWYDHSQIHVRGFSSWGSVYCIMIKVHKFHVQKGYLIYFYHIGLIFI